MQSRTMRGAGCGGEQSGREREGEVVGRGGQDGFDRVGRMRLKGGRDLLLAHKDLVVVLDEAARTVTRKDVPSVGVGDGLLPAHQPAQLTKLTKNELFDCRPSVWSDDATCAI